MAKHYVSVNESGVVLRGFSDDFEQPTENDVCINEDGDRHFELNGVVNPPMADNRGVPLYKLVDGLVVERTDTEKSADIVPDEPDPTFEERLAAVEALVKGSPSYGELLEAVNLLLGDPV